MNRRLIIIHGTYGLYGDEFTAPEASCKTIFQGAYGGLTFVTAAIYGHKNLIPDGPGPNLSLLV